MEEEGAGINPKTEYNIRAVQRKWLAFVATFGDRLAEKNSIHGRRGPAGYESGSKLVEGRGPRSASSA